MITLFRVVIRKKWSHKYFLSSILCWSCQEYGSLMLKFHTRWFCIWFSHPNWAYNTALSLENSKNENKWDCTGRACSWNAYSLPCYGTITRRRLRCPGKRTPQFCIMWQLGLPDRRGDSRAMIWVGNKHSGKQRSLRPRSTLRCLVMCKAT